jgi:hypothetical protein
VRSLSYFALSQYFCFLSYNVIGWLGLPFLRWKGIKKNTRLALDCIWFRIFLYLNFMLQRVWAFNMHDFKLLARNKLLSHSAGIV